MEPAATALSLCPPRKKETHPKPGTNSPNPSSPLLRSHLFGAPTYCNPAQKEKPGPSLLQALQALQAFPTRGFLCVGSWFHHTVRQTEADTHSWRTVDGPGTTTTKKAGVLTNGNGEQDTTDQKPGSQTTPRPRVWTFEGRFVGWPFA
jgi:hypothetical protein